MSIYIQSKPFPQVNNCICNWVLHLLVPGRMYKSNNEGEKTSTSVIIFI